jgi:nucleoside-diphosphate-sugar epimerase
MSKALVTGGNGYLGTQLIAALLGQGQEVRATVRSLDSEPDLREALRRGGADDNGLEVVTADLTIDNGWAEVMAGVQDVHHVASPIPPVQPEDPNDLIVPAREGTLRVLRAASEAGAHRVVLTSSFAAVGYSPKAVRDFTEDDWTDPDTPGLAPYPRSKAIAERAAWDYIEQNPGETELVVLNPTFIIGPTLMTSLRSSLVAIKAIVEGTMPALPRQRFGVADVRDVADAHLRAAAAPDAANKRYLLLADGPTITWLELAESIRDHLGPAGANVSLHEASGESPAPLTIHNDRARRELGWQPRAIHTTIADTVDSLHQLGLLELR